MARWPACVARSWFTGHGTRCCGPDEPQQELVAADVAGCGPGRDGGADRSVGPAVGHVRGQDGDDAEASSQRARAGTASRCRAANKTTMEDEYTSPSIVAGSSCA